MSASHPPTSPRDSDFAARLREAVRRCPATCALVAAAVVLHVVVLVSSWYGSDASGSGLREWGAMKSVQRADTPELRGHFDLWEGEYWRIPVSVLHHGGLTSIPGVRFLVDFVWMLGVVAACGWLGWRLEPIIGSGALLGVCLFGGMLGLCSEFLLGRDPVGLIPAVFTLLGILIVLSRQDDELRAALGEVPMIVAAIWLMGSVPLAVLDWLNVPGLAGFVGLVYGLLVGRAMQADPETGRYRLRWSVPVVALHLLLIPIGWAAAHPFWSGRYLWYQASLMTDHRERVARWSLALRLDPGLAPVWWEWAEALRQRDEVQEAWEIVLQGLQAHRSDERGIELAAAIWQELSTDSARTLARQQLADQFGGEALDWQKRLGVGERIRLPGQPLPDGTGGARQLSAAERYPLDQQIILPPTFDGLPEHPVRELHAPDVDPDAPDSAAAGWTL